MKAIYKAIDSEGTPFSWTLEAIRVNGVLYVRHGPNCHWFLANGSAYPDEIVEDCFCGEHKGIEDRRTK